MESQEVKTKYDLHREQSMSIVLEHKVEELEGKCQVLREALQACKKLIDNKAKGKLLATKKQLIDIAENAFLAVDFIDGDPEILKSVEWHDPDQADDDEDEDDDDEDEAESKNSNS